MLRNDPGVLRLHGLHAQGRLHVLRDDEQHAGVLRLRQSTIRSTSPGTARTISPCCRALKLARPVKYVYDLHALAERTIKAQRAGSKVAIRVPGALNHGADCLLRLENQV